MRLTDQGRQRVAEIAQRRGFSFEAAEVMLAALANGNGSQAQFSHPELGGMGQWASGGMLMIGDMFNNGLKARVDGLATELSGLVGSASLFQPPAAAEDGLFAASALWPAELGAPSSSGSQNETRYAVFPAHRRLAVMRGGRVSLYDTGDRLIGGVSQQQGGGAEGLVFSSQYGPVSLSDLVEIPPQGAEPDAPPEEPSPPRPAAPEAQATPEAEPEPAPASEADEAAIFRKIEQLHDLFSRGVITQTEFETKKAELLSRL